MIVTILIALVAATVFTHGLGLGLLLRHILPSIDHPPKGLWPITWLLIRTVWTLILFHTVCILFWTLFYLRSGCLPDAESAFYFSGSTYTTLGYGDILLPQPWRLLAPIEALTGILMCSLSGALIFAIVSRIYSVSKRIHAS